MSIPTAITAPIRMPFRKNTNGIWAIPAQTGITLRERPPGRNAAAYPDGGRGVLASAAPCRSGRQEVGPWRTVGRSCTVNGSREGDLTAANRLFSAPKRGSCRRLADAGGGEIPIEELFEFAIRRHRVVWLRRAVVLFRRAFSPVFFYAIIGFNSDAARMLRSSHPLRCAPCPSDPRSGRESRLIGSNWKAEFRVRLLGQVPRFRGRPLPSVLSNLTPACRCIFSPALTALVILPLAQTRKQICAILRRHGSPPGPETKPSGHGAKSMTVTFNMSMLQPIVALVAGLLILLIPRNLELHRCHLSHIHRCNGVVASPSIRPSALERFPNGLISKRKGFGREEQSGKGMTQR